MNELNRLQSLATTLENRLFKNSKRGRSHPLNTSFQGDSNVIEEEYAIPSKRSPSYSPAGASTNESFDISLDASENQGRKIQLLEKELQYKNAKICQLEAKLQTKSGPPRCRSVDPGARSRERQLEEQLQKQDAKISEDKKTLQRLQDLNHRLMSQIKSLQSTETSTSVTADALSNITNTADTTREQLVRRNHQLEIRVRQQEQIILVKAKEYSELIQSAKLFESKTREIYDRGSQLQARMEQFFDKENEYQEYQIKQIQNKMLQPDQLEEIVKIRHHIHQNPEICYEEYQTSSYIKTFFQQKGVQENDIKSYAETGFTVNIRGTGPESTTPLKIAYRSELDALPMEEANPDLPYRSTNANAAHMCGHDGHMACLMAFGWFLIQNAGLIPQNCSVLLIFQPAEEAIGGADRMCQEGAIDDVDEVYCMHCSPHELLGNVFCLDNEMTAHRTTLKVTVNGKGGHGSSPELCIDPLGPACQMVVALNSIHARNISCHDKAVFTICEIKSGSVSNVVPDSAYFTGTIRTYDMSMDAKFRQRIQSICQGIGTSMDCQVTVDFAATSYPPCINHPVNAEYVRAAARRVLGNDSVVFHNPDTGSEDFSYFIQKKPGAIFYQGTGYTHQGWHESTFNFNDDMIPLTLKVYIALLEDRMGINLS